jgi:hypothetical protein
MRVTNNTRARASRAPICRAGRPRSQFRRHNNFRSSLAEMSRDKGARGQRQDLSPLIPAPWLLEFASEAIQVQMNVSAAGASLLLKTEKSWG